MEVKPGYKQTEVGVIPEEWHVQRLGELGEALIGLTYKPSDVRQHGTLVLRSSNIQNDALAFDDNVFVDTDIPERIKVRPGDVLVCVRNGSRNLIGKTALLDERGLGMTFGAFMAVYRSPIGRLASYLFQSEILKRQINEHLGATINQITNKSLNSFRIPVSPDEAERDAIATALSDVDALLGWLDRLIAKKRDLKQAAMQQLLTGQTRLPGFSGAWEVKRLGDVLVRLNAKAYQIQTSDYQATGKYPVIDQGKEQVIGYSDNEEKCLRCPDGGVVVFGDHTCFVKFIAFDFLVGADGTQILLGKAGQNTRFHAFQLQYRGVEPTGYNRHFKFLKERAFAVPPLPEQAAIAAVLSDMDAELAALEARSDKTRDLKQAMMQELLTGKTRLV
ncbi:MAG: restriction endonuclease subunit S [Rhodospirillales bacterium]|nr:restriction endonuclease subunit S [Rhodospirillales bacterium]